jgi:lysophospholipase L1-like esterase
MVKGFFMNMFQLFFNKVIGVLFGLLLSGMVFGVTTYAQETIIGFGDSITTGSPFLRGSGNGRRLGGYEPTLEKLLNDAGLSSIVLNYGVGGEQTPEGVNRIDSVLSGHAARYILIMEGTNDQWRGVSAQTTAFNISVMIDKSKANQTSPVIGTLTPASRDINQEIPRQYNPAIRNIIREKNVQWVDHYSLTVGNWENLEYDSVHPNEAGYEALANNWFNKINSLSDSSSSSGCFISTSKLSVNN